MEPAPSSMMFACAEDPQRGRLGGMGVGTAFDPRRSVISVGSEHLTVQHQGSGTVVAYRLDALRAAVDLTQDGARHLGIEGPNPLRREPVIGHLVRGTRDTIMTAFPSTERFSTVALVFAAPSPGPRGVRTASEPGVETEHGLWRIDALYLDVVQVRSLIDALRANGVPIASTVGEVLASTVGTLDDPAEAAAVSAARRRRRLRVGWLTMSPWLIGFVVAPAIGALGLAFTGDWWWTPVLLAVSGLSFRALRRRIDQAADST